MTAEQIQETIDSVNKVLNDSANKLEKYAAELRSAARGWYLYGPSPIGIKAVANDIEETMETYWEMHRQAKEEYLNERQPK